MSTILILVWTRYTLLAFLFFACLTTEYLEVIYLPWRFLWMLFGVALLTTVWVHRFVVPKAPVGIRALFSHLLFDSVFLTFFFGVTGGPMNPYTSLYLVPLIYAAMVLPLSLSLFLFGLSWLGYLVISFHYIPLRVPVTSTVTMMDVHFLGMILSFTLSACIAVFFVSKLSQNLRRKEQELKDVKTVLALEDQFAKMGVLAANAVHQLNTPLSTLAMIHESFSAADLPASQASLLSVFQTQLHRCQMVLDKILKSFGVLSFKLKSEKLFSDVVSGCVDALQKQYPNHVLTSQFLLDDMTVSDAGYLEEILLHGLENALAVATEVSLGVSQVGSQIVLDIKDNGPGFDAFQIQRILSPLPDQVLEYVDKPSSTRGLGLILMQFMVKRLGGTLCLNSSDQGSHVQVSLQFDKVKKA